MVVVPLKIWCRFRHRGWLNVQWDDYMSIVALALANGFFYVCIIGQILYTLSITAIKLSVLAFYWRLFEVKARLTIYVVTGASIAWCTAIMLCVIFNCIPVQAAWDITIKDPTCIPTKSIYLGGSVPNVILDLVIVMMPLPHVWRLHAPLAQRIVLAGMFALGTFIAVVSLVRLIIFLQIPFALQGDVSYNFREIIVWSIVEINIGLTCACLPSLKPAFQMVGLNKLFSFASSRPSDIEGPSHQYASGGSSNSRPRKRGATGGLFSTLAGMSRLDDEEEETKFAKDDMSKNNVEIELGRVSNDSGQRTTTGGTNVQKNWSVLVDERRAGRISNAYEAPARTVETEAVYPGGLEQDGSSQSSGLTSPMLSPKSRALETPLSSEEAATGKESRYADSPNSMSFYNCFNSQNNPRGHFYSANRLFTRGIWIGYLAPDRQSESFRGLPSFQELKFNCAKFSPPHPPVIQGSAGQTRQAVCRGCAASNSAVIPLSEIQFYRKSKLVIMPLDGDDEAGVFAIMLPQKSDRSLKGLQCYRPYEITNDGRGEIFVNDYMVLTLRNPHSDAGVLATALEVLQSHEFGNANTKTMKRPISESLDAYGTTTVFEAINADISPSISRVLQKVATEEDEVEEYQLPSRNEAKGSAKSTRRRDEGILPGDNGHIKPEAGRIRQENSIPIAFSKPSPQSTRPAFPIESIPLDLIDEQAKRVYLFWPIKHQDVDYEFVHTLKECKSFTGLLSMLEEETEAIPPIAEILARTRTWRLSYSIGDGTNKAIIARKGMEAAFDRLQTTLTQASIWGNHSQGRVYVELKSLSRPDSACVA
ncbi:integral membrane protein [Stemphylium lycopersici]|nr:integral membrane protein [Stemphylium lycopersici]RAR03789.1 integral membrane protein [Stemphylium lycopersici]